jgi:zinc transport system substrate-binding protein
MWRFTALLVVVALAGCGGSNGGGGTSKKLVVAAFYPLAWAAGQIAGSDAEVVNLTPPGAEPHDVELSPGDVESVHDADLVLYLGGGFQPALEHALTGRTGQSVDLLEGRTLRQGASAEGDGAADPHVWLDPRLFAGIVREIGRALGRPEPAAELAAKLRTLDRELQAGLERCQRREIVTSHAAFGYLARRYGLEQIALTGLSPGAEPSPGDLVRLVDAVRASGATTVFFETLVPPDLAETVAREAGATTAVLDPLEGLTRTELDAGEDYFSVMRANLAALRKALGCP